ncbi:MAG TPA: VWA domain-containing protein [Candidatus Omnitrophota bacterium]|nr:VWA domain-containing protein [Candidatus Omnitrophota bacterium]
MNDFLNTGKITIAGEEYRLPSNIHIVVNASIIRNRTFSSPFFNRFQKIVVPATIDEMVIEKNLLKRYPGLTNDEASLVVKSAITAWLVDGGFKLGRFNAGGKHFENQYYFSVDDVNMLAESVIRDKKLAVANGIKEVNAAYIVLKAVVGWYGEALDDVGKGNICDREMFFEVLLNEVFTYDGIERSTIRGIEKELREPKYDYSYQDEIDLKAISGENQVTRRNGIIVLKDDVSYRVITPAHAYRILPEKEGKEFFSTGLSAELKNGKLILYYRFIKSIGGIETGLNDATKPYILPPEEVPPKDFLEYEGYINEVARSVLMSWERAKDAMGYERSPRPVIMLGETGGAKSSIARNLTHITGTPMYTLNCFENMEGDSVLARVTIEYGEGASYEINMDMHEFFSQFGKVKVDGKYENIGSGEHTKRKILLLDEANVSADVIYFMSPFFHGARKADFYFGGKHFEFELDPEVMVIVTGNPATSYEGRQSYGGELMERATKLWVPALHFYRESDRVERETVVKVLEGRHRADALAGDRETVFKGKRSVRGKLPGNNEKDVFDASAKIPGIKSTLPEAIERPKEEKKKKKKEGVSSEVIIKPIDCHYDLEKVRTALDNIEKITGSDPKAVNILKYQKFLDEVLHDFFLGVSNLNRDAGVMLWKEGDMESLAGRVCQAAEEIDPYIGDRIKMLLSIWANKKGTKEDIKMILNQMRTHILSQEGVNRFLFSIETKKGKKLVLKLETREIERRVVIKAEDLLAVGVKEFGKNEIMAYVVEDHPFAEADKYRGVFKGGDYAIVYRKSTGKNPVFQDWVGQHELGHVTDAIRFKQDQISHHNIELFSTLFPLMFSASPSGYLKKGIMSDLQGGDRSSYYCQAAKGIINAMIRILREKEDKRVSGMDKLIDEDFDRMHPAMTVKEEGWIEFEQGKILDLVNSLKDEQLRDMAKQMYRDAWEKRFSKECYLSTVRKGVYKAKRSKGRGDSVSEITDGLEGVGPDMEYVDDDADSQEVQQQVEGISEDGDDDAPEITSSETGETVAGEKETDMVRAVQRDWLDTYVQKVGRAAQKFVDIFTSAPKYERVMSRSGSGNISIQHILSRSMKPFIKYIADFATPNIIAGITIDTSGSIGGADSAMGVAFTNMSKFFLSLMHKSSKGNSGVHFSVSSITSRLDEVVSFDQCRDKDTLAGAPEKLWHVGTGEGIDTVALLQGLSKKYAKYRNSPSPKMEIVLTDGGERSGRSFSELNKMVKEFESEYGVELVFVGVTEAGCRDVANYERYIQFKTDPTTDMLCQMMLKLGTTKVSRGHLPEGDLGKKLFLDGLIKPDKTKVSGVRIEFNKAGGSVQAVASKIRPTAAENISGTDKKQEIEKAVSGTLDHVRFPERKTIILMPKPVSDKTQSRQELQRILRKEYGLNIEVRFYEDTEDGALAAFNKVETDLGKDGKTIALAYVNDKNFETYSAKIQNKNQFKCIKEEIPAGGYDLEYIGLHVAIGIGLSDLVRNKYGANDANKAILLENLVKLLNGLCAVKESGLTVNNFEEIFGGKFTLRFKPASKEIEENMIAAEAVAIAA